MESKSINGTENKTYSSHQYWDDRYEIKKGSTFEWLENWAELQPIFQYHRINGFYNPNQKQIECFPQQIKIKNKKYDSISRKNELNLPIDIALDIQHLVANPWNNQQSMSNLNGTALMIADTYDASCKIKKEIKILNIGCGNSCLSDDMYDDGYESIWNIDTSSVVIKQMHERSKTSRPNMIWKTMDVQDMKYEDEFFDIIIDKSTIDCIVCCQDSQYLVANTMKEVQRVLKTGGCFISISFTGPKVRLSHFERPFQDFEMSIHEIFKEHYMGEITYHYVYIMTKGAQANQKLKEQLSYAHKSQSQQKKDNDK